MKTNKQIAKLIQMEYERQRRGLELIASENYVSGDVLSAMGSVLTNKYAEGYPAARYYGGCEIVDMVENLAIDRVKKLFGAEYANVQPHSGSQANAAVYSSFINPGDKILGLDLSHGGHLTHGSPISFSGKLYKTSFYGVEKETGRIDYNKLSDTAQKEKPKLIIAGASAYPRDIDFKKLREIADGVGAILFADISHPAGLIAKGLLSDPLPHCHVVSSTTHKTLRGPRGGIIMMHRDFDNLQGIKTPKGELRRMSAVINLNVFPGQQGGPLEHIIAAKAVAFGEALTEKFTKYIRQVQLNAKAMEKTLASLGYDMVSGGTDNHLILIDLRNKNITGKEAEQALVKAEITVNKNMVPFDDRSPFITSGIRIGTAAITTRGLKEKDMESVIYYLDEVIRNHDKPKVISQVAGKVEKMMGHLPLYKG